MIKLSIRCLLLFVCTIGWMNPILTLAADDIAYPPAPAGINWGWQGEVFFGFDSAAIRKEDKVVLNQITDILKQYNEVSVLITGRADNSGDIEYNRKLSKKRVSAIVNYLVKAGIAKPRIVTQSIGEERPVTNNACPEDRKRNRRADLAFFPTGYEYSIETPQTMRNESQPREGECEELKAKLQPKSPGTWQ